MSFLCLMLIKSSWLNSSLELAFLTLCRLSAYLVGPGFRKGKILVLDY